MKVIRDCERIKNYITDESSRFIADIDAIEEIYYPESEEDIQIILRNANKKKLLCTISGAGTSVTGSRVPIHGGAVISMEKMLNVNCQRSNLERIEYRTLIGKCSIEIDRKNNEAYVPPGILIKDLRDVLPDCLFYPPNPTESSAMIGGNVSTNASGSLSFYYGTTRDWINGLTIVLANNDILRIKRGHIFANSEGLFDFNSDSNRNYRFKIPSYKMPVVKNSAGLYTKENMDIIDLFIGSEGILGIITEINIKLCKKEENTIADIAFFKSNEDAFGYADALRKEKGNGILSIEYFDNNSLDFLREKHPILKPHFNACVSIEALNNNQVMTLLPMVMEKYNVIDDWYADTSQEIAKHRDFRHSLPEGINGYLRQIKGKKIGTDFVVSVDKFHQMKQSYRKAGEEFKKQFKRQGIHYLLFGHIGDCHLHFNFITHNDKELDYANRLYLKMAKEAISLGGTISGEHGVGKKVINIHNRAIPLLEIMYGQEGLSDIARIKRIFDPNLILNVGNMVPREFLIIR